MTLTVVNLVNWDFQIDKWVEHGTVDNLSVYIALAQAFSMSFINDPRYRDGDKQKGARRKESVVTKASVCSIEACKGRIALYFSDVSCMVITGL